MEFNSNEYSWKNVEVIVFGRPLVRILEVKYKFTQELKPIYGRGTKPQSIQPGNESFTGSYKIGQSELESLNKKATENGFDHFGQVEHSISICYAKNGVVVTDVIVGARISDFEKAMKQGDPDMEIDLPFQALKIEYQTLPV